MTPSPRPSRKVELKLKTRKVQRKVRGVPSRRRGNALDFLDNLGMGRNNRRAQFSNTSIIAVILLFCRRRTCFPWTLIHEIVSMRFTISLQLSPFSLCTDIYSHLHLSSIIGRIKTINRWESWFRDRVECCWYRPKVRSGSSPLRLREYAHNRRPWIPVNGNEKLLYCQGALASKYPVPSGPRDTKALTFRQYLLNWFFSFCFHLNKIKYFLFFRRIRQKGAKRSCSLKSLLLLCAWLCWPRTPRSSPGASEKILVKIKKISVLSNFLIKRS